MNKQEFGARLLSLPKIFDGHLFTVPDYQRGYAWDKEQVTDLLKDIEHLMNDGVALRHYTGTLVLSRPLAVGDGEFHVVDGQQRLTTLVIFLSLLCKRLTADQQELFAQLYLRRGELGNDRSVLRLNSDTRTFFEKVVLADGDTNSCPVSLEAHQRLLTARSLIGKWLDSKQAAGVDIEEIRRTVETELGFLVYTPKEDSETGIMFEVINNRGKPLSELEKVKNYLIYCSVKLGAVSLRESIDQDWSEILKNLNLALKTTPGDEGAFLRYCLVVHFSINKTDSQHGYDELKKRLKLDDSLKDAEAKKKAIHHIAQFVEFMKTASHWYARLYGQMHSGIAPEIVTIMNKIRAQAKHASIMPLFLALVIKKKGNGLRLLQLMRLLEILNFRVYMAWGMTSRNDTGQGDLYRYAMRYYHGTLLEREFSPDDRKVGGRLMETDEDALEYCMVRFIQLYASDERFTKSFRLDSESPNDFYKWPGLRYFLMNYEENCQPNKTIPIDKILLGTKDGKTADYLSVEHLWATNNRSGEGENSRKQDRFERRRLGNFVLLELRLNIQGSADDLEHKIDWYRGGPRTEPPTDLEHVRYAADDADTVLKELQGREKTLDYYLDLHRKLNDLQEDRYCRFAESRWSLKDYLGNGHVQKESLELAAEEA